MFHPFAGLSLFSVPALLIFAFLHPFRRVLPLAFPRFRNGDFLAPFAIWRPRFALPPKAQNLAKQRASSGSRGLEPYARLSRKLTRSRGRSPEHKPTDSHTACRATHGRRGAHKGSSCALTLKLSSRIGVAVHAVVADDRILQRASKRGRGCEFIKPQS